MINERLAYVLDSTGAPVCVLLPVSTWAVFYANLFYAEDYVSSNFSSAMGAYISAIPFCFYPFIALLFVFLFCMGWMPKLGAMKKAYKRVEETGMVYSENSKKYNMDEEEEGGDGNIWDFLIPILALVFIGIFSGEILLGVLAFVTGSNWGMSAVVIPILVPMAQALDANIVLTMAAIISGSVFGSHACFYTDATILSSNAARIENMEHALSQWPYVFIAAALSTVCFLACGFIMT